MSAGGVRRLISAVSAVSFGIAGWGVAHLATDLLLAHDHYGSGRHVHGYVAPLAIAGGCLAIASLLAVFLAGLAGRAHAPAIPARRRGIRAAAGLSTIAFAAAELGEPLLSGGQQLPPPLVVLTAFVIYLAVGVGTSLLWRSSVRAVHRAARQLLNFWPMAPKRAPLPLTAAIPDAVKPAHWPLRWAGRGPPALSA